MKRSIRITPAYAGKTRPKAAKRCAPWDHPRVCGKDQMRKLFLKPLRGSPPRMRERRDIQVRGGRFSRITPAYAGKTNQAAVWDDEAWDHPRVCGKDRLCQCLLICFLGSPPRMRERHGTSAIVPFSTGITPAYAGKTETDTDGQTVIEDHPRVCGKDCDRIFGI